MALAFTIPALVMIGYWDSFSFSIIFGLAAVGGLLGVFLSIPLRRAMILESGLKFPEGIATAEVLKVGTEGSAAKYILFSAVAAAVIKFCQSGLQILQDTINIWGRVGNTVFGVSTGFSLALIGAGYVVGLGVSISIFVGAAFSWGFAVPLYGALFGLPLEAETAYDAAVSIWNAKIRIIGVGMMVFGGLWMLIDLFKPLKAAIVTSLEAVQKVKAEGHKNIIRTEFDIPITYVASGVILLILPMYLLFQEIVLSSGLDISFTMVVLVAIFITVLTYVISTFGSVISAYLCGLLGTSFSPISGVVLMGVLIVSFFLLLIFGFQIDFLKDKHAAMGAAGITLLISTVFGCATAIAGDNLQDLKSGQLVGATPWKQQVMLGIGVIASSIALAPIFQLLFEAYGFGDVLPREGMDPAQALSAPKAALMAAVSEAIFTQSMDWTMIVIGILLGVIVLLFDKILEKNDASWRLPVVAVAVGIYLPLDITVPLLFGGLVSTLSHKAMNKKKATHAQREAVERKGVLFASGLIAGEAIIGIIIAIPFIAYENTNVFRIVPDAIKNSTDVFGLLVFIAMIYWFYNVASKIDKR